VDEDQRFAAALVVVADGDPVDGNRAHQSYPLFRSSYETRSSTGAPVIA
jgi:hypothetical protein